MFTLKQNHQVALKLETVLGLSAPIIRKYNKDLNSHLDISELDH
jgi:hypothetical protein